MISRKLCREHISKKRHRIPFRIQSFYHIAQVPVRRLRTGDLGDEICLIFSKGEQLLGRLEHVLLQGGRANKCQKRPTIGAKETHYVRTFLLQGGKLLVRELQCALLLLRRPNQCQMRPTIGTKETYYMRTFQASRSLFSSSICCADFSRSA
jgi:hypothetical protein